MQSRGELVHTNSQPGETARVAASPPNEVNLDAADLQIPRIVRQAPGTPHGMAALNGSAERQLPVVLGGNCGTSRDPVFQKP